ncbi:MAG: DNA-3-methyladenine glycosylase family protein [Christensenellales bacterium]
MGAIIIQDDRDFDIRHILDCGQIFRYRQTDAGDWIINSLDKRCLVSRQGKGYEIQCDDEDYFRRFFDLDTDYSLIKSQLSDKPLMRQAIEYGHGIRILKQDKWEMLISFIISANNHIPRIKGIIERLCDALGKDMGEYRAFPTPQAMAEQSVEFYKSIGAGYRDKYLLNTARAVCDGFDLECVQDMDAEQGAKYLCRLLGVGRKVADCILLFGYHKSDVFPVDTWIRKVYFDLAGQQGKNDGAIRRYLLDLYGDNSGYAQQYLFFNKREN